MDGSDWTDIRGTQPIRSIEMKTPRAAIEIRSWSIKTQPQPIPRNYKGYNIDNTLAKRSE